MSGRYALLTFGAGLPNWRAAARRLASQASKSGWFSEVLCYDESQLAHKFPDFSKQHGRLLNSRVRGYGYWIWKPYLIWQTLAQGRKTRLDGVLYLDAGCEINCASSFAYQRMEDYWNLARENGGIFAMHLPGHAESRWTRHEVLDYFNVSGRERQTDQIQATPMMTSSDFALEFAENWYRLCVDSDYFLVRDPQDTEPLSHDFRAHRHDQSVFSCLVKQRNLLTVADETFWAPDWFAAGARYPLWAARNRTRVSVLDRSATGRAWRTFEKTYSRAHSTFWEGRR